MQMVLKTFQAELEVVLCMSEGLVYPFSEVVLPDILTFITHLLFVDGDRSPPFLILFNDRIAMFTDNLIIDLFDDLLLLVTVILVAILKIDGIKNNMIMIIVGVAMCVDDRLKTAAQFLIKPFSQLIAHLVDLIRINIPSLEGLFNQMGLDVLILILRLIKGLSDDPELIFRIAGIDVQTAHGNTLLLLCPFVLTLPSVEDGGR